MSAPTYEEWRLGIAIELSNADLDELAERIRDQASIDVDVHRRTKGDLVAYAFDRQTLRQVERIARRLVRETGVPAAFTTTRWNPGKECWQGPRLPIQASAKRLPPEWLHLGQLGWEVRLHCLYDQRVALELELRAEGLPLFSDGFRRLMVGARTEGEAKMIEYGLKKRHPGLAIEIRPLSRWRRWLIATQTGPEGAGTLGFDGPSQQWRLEVWGGGGGGGDG